MSRDREGDDSSPGISDPTLSHLLATDVDLDIAFDRLLHHPEGSAEDEPAHHKLVLEGAQLDRDGLSLSALLASVLAEYEEIDRLLDQLRESADGTVSGEASEEAVAFVSDDELGDPEALERAVAPLQKDRERFEELFHNAHQGLERLDAYRLSRRSPQEVVSAMRSEENAGILRDLVAFLRTLSQAADSFEALGMPENEIRGYLCHLYLMKDWQEMARLVRLLEAFAKKFTDEQD